MPASPVEPADWSHITKLDPDKELSDEVASGIAESGTDAVVVGGTQGVTREKARSFLSVLDGTGVPVVVEPSNPANVVRDGHDLLVPTVLNAGSVDWVVGAHKEWVRVEDGVDWSIVHPEAYIVLNPDSAVGRVTEARTEIEPDEAAAYATVADRFFDLPIVYVEYSGTYGEPEVVEAVAEAVDDATVFYGGGIDDYEKAREMARHADCIVVGDVAHEKGMDALRETVRGAKDA
ncbi:MAG: heptaprenylglyceryl phosphate synthase [Halobacteriales archaeon]|nr:heptaprenylglyceryl phosphate synthase [Halobacteriales archaeon]